VMYLGKIVEVGPAEEVLTRPLHPYTQALLEVAPGPGGAASERPVLAGEPPDPTRIPPGCRFHPRCPVVASGRAAALELEERNRTEIPELLELRPGHYAACHVAAATTGSLGGPTPSTSASG
jgi:oligopeptide/dipeptide ABC transporter ATP-binding protein